MRRKGRQTIICRCCARCMLYSVSTHDNGMERYRGMTHLCVLQWWLSCGQEWERWGMERRTMRRVCALMRNQWYDLPDWVEMTSCQWNYTPDQNSSLPYRGWQIDPHTKFSIVPVSDHVLFQLLSSRVFWSSALPSAMNTKWSHLSLSLPAMIQSWQRVQHR